MKKETKFSYTYSASEAEEIRKIREKYTFKSEKNSVLEEVRKLDKKAELSGTIVSILIGMVGTIVFGTGLSCILEWADDCFVLGIIIGIVGMLLIGAAYPAFVYITKRQQRKIAPEILKLTEEFSDM